MRGILEVLKGFQKVLEESEAFEGVGGVLEAIEDFWVW